MLFPSAWNLLDFYLPANLFRITYAQFTPNLVLDLEEHEQF